MGILDYIGVFFESMSQTKEDINKDLVGLKKAVNFNQRDLDEVKDELKLVREQANKNYSNGKEK
jgi:hypothetical protein